MVLIGCNLAWKMVQILGFSAPVRFRGTLKVLLNTKPRREGKFRGCRFSDVWESVAKEKKKQPQNIMVASLSLYLERATIMNDDLSPVWYDRPTLTQFQLWKLHSVIEWIYTTNRCVSSVSFIHSFTHSFIWFRHGGPHSTEYRKRKTNRHLLILRNYKNTDKQSNSLKHDNCIWVDPSVEASR